MLLDFKKLIKEIYPDLAAKYDSKQYELSEEIISIKVKGGHRQREMAKLMGVSFNQYLDMEIGSTEIPVSVYVNALNKLKKNRVL